MLDFVKIIIIITIIMIIIVPGEKCVDALGEESYVTFTD